MTLTDYFNTPETVLPQELIYGHIRVAEAPFVSHQRVVLNVAIAMETHARTHGSGEVFVSPIDVVLDRNRALVVQPDLLFIAQARRGIVLDRIYGPPDLVLEVLSPNPRIGQLDERVRWFATYGVREIWIYHQPEQRLDILRCENGRVASRRAVRAFDRIQSAVLPMFDPSLGSIVA